MNSRYFWSSIFPWLYTEYINWKDTWISYFCQEHHVFTIWIGECTKVSNELIFVNWQKTLFAHLHLWWAQLWVIICSWLRIHSLLQRHPNFAAFARTMLLKILKMTKQRIDFCFNVFDSPSIREIKRKDRGEIYMVWMTRSFIVLFYWQYLQ